MTSLPNTDETALTPAPMSRRHFTAAAATAALGALGLSACGGTAKSATLVTAPSSTAAAAAASGTTRRTIARTASAAEAFLATLSAAQRERVLYGYRDETKTTSWSNFPVTFVERAGLNLTTDLNRRQRAAAMKVLQALLSESGYATVAGIIAGDGFLHEESSSTEDSLGQYYIAFFGAPSASRAWEVQFGGHHLGINATLDGSKRAITFAPTHLGSQPAIYTDDEGADVQPLAGMYEDAFAFFHSLDSGQRSATYQGEELGMMTCTPGSTCSFPTASGLAGSELSARQKRLLLAVISNWVGLSDAQTTRRALARVASRLDDTYVTWSGQTTYDMAEGEGIYYSISGPNCFIELACQQGSAGADVDGYITAGWGHIHTIYRDPTNDYAGSVTQQEGWGMGGGMPPGGP